MSKKKSFEEIEVLNDLTYNPTSDCYVFFSKKLSKNIVLRGETFRDISRNYSNLLGGEGSTISELSRTYAIPREILVELIRIAKITHDDIPFTKEEIKDKDPDTIVEDLLELKKFQIVQGFNKKSWQVTQQNSTKWMEFEQGVYNPVTNWLKKWKPPVYAPYKPLESTQKGLSLMVFCSDWHFGAKEDKGNLFKGDNTSTDKTARIIKEYAQKVIDDVKGLNLNIDSLVINGLGDLLHTANPFGTTTKGTPLRYDQLNEQLFDTAFNSLIDFIYQLSQLAPVTKIYACKGNHFGVGDSILFKAAAAYFRNQKNIKFNIFHTHVGCYREKNMLCIASHGAHDSVKAKGKRGPALQSYIQTLIINSKLNTNGIKARAAFFADLHHIESKEYADFDYLLCPSILKGDLYADALGLYSKSRQQAFLVDDNGIKATLNYTF